MGSFSDRKGLTLNESQMETYGKDGEIILWKDVLSLCLDADQCKPNTNSNTISYKSTGSENQPIILNNSKTGEGYFQVCNFIDNLNLFFII